MVSMTPPGLARAGQRLAVVLACSLAMGLGGARAQSAAPIKGATKAQPAGPRHLLWTDLVPKGWDPMAQLRGQIKEPNVAMFNDGDPQVIEWMRQLREVWDSAPVNPEMEGVSGRLPGYVVPLDDSRKGMKSFLLVPYYGACIHSPPPPANQIVHVLSDTPIKGFQAMDTVWVHGTLQAFRGDSAMGVSGWRIQALKVERYERASGPGGR